MPILEVTELAKTFKSRQRAEGLSSSLRSFIAPRYREHEAVKQISFTLEAGEVLAFIGPNGAGKSTTIKMLTGILYPTSGDVRVLGLTPWRQRRKLAFRISSVFGQKSQLWYHLPPQDTFNLLAHIYELDMKAYRKRRDFLIEVFDIASYISTPARKLSLGERMRCELAAALLHKPEILFLDEPTIGLDVIAKQRIRDLIGQLNREEGMTVFLTSHDAGDIEHVCQRAIVINHGEVILDTPVARMKHDFLKVKTVDLLLDEVAETLLQTDAEQGTQRLRILAPGSVQEDLQDTAGVKILKAKGRELKLEVDTARNSLEPILAAIMQRCHILDMTIADPPMEEIIATIYSKNDSLWLFFWWTYFHQFPLTHGWQATDIVLLWAVTASGFGLSASLLGNARQIVTLVINGGLDAYLGMPRYVLLHVCIAATDPTGWGDILFAVGSYLLLVRPDVWHIGLFVFLAVLVSLIFTSFMVSFSCLAFFLGNTEGLVQQMYGALVTFSTYPMNIFNGAVRVLLFTLIPAGFISFVPLQLLHRFTWPLLGLMIGATALIVLVAVGVFELGLRRYESGNLLGMQG